MRRPSPHPRAAALAALALATLVACGAPNARPSEEKVEYVEMQGTAQTSAAPAPAAPAAPASPPSAADEADFSGGGVAGGGAAGVVRARAAEPPAAGRTAAAPLPRSAAATQGADAAAAAPEAAPMLIRTGSASVQVDSLEPAVARLRALARAAGGYVANVSLQGGREQARAATLELRVPAARFDEVVGGLTPVGRVERVDVQAQDVGEEFVDVQARVANARRLEARLLDLLDRRTGRLREVLEVEGELARVREEIERYDGRLRFLRTRAATSTLAVTVHEPPPLLARSPAERPVADAARRAGRNFVALVAAVIASSGVWAPLGLVAWGAWRWRRRHVARLAARGGAAPATPPPAPPAPSAA